MKIAFLRLLLTSTFLTAPMCETALAQAVKIDDRQETVSGSGGGTMPSPWNIANVLYVGYSSRGALTVENGGTVGADGGVIIADVEDSDGTLIIGAPASKPAAGSGKLAAATVAFGSGTGTLVFNHNSDGYNFGAAISGSGTIDVHSGRTVLLGDSSGFLGMTNIKDGQLFVNGILGGATFVDGLLGGTGSVAAAIIRAGGEFAPGNSIGKLTVTGNLEFADNSIYDVEVNDGGNVAGVNNDFADVGGLLTIGSGVFVRIGAANGSDDGSTYAPGLVYTILTADGGIAGTFAQAVTKMAFLAPELSYDANNVYLTLLQQADLDDVAGTPNQRDVSGTIQNFGPGHPLYDEMLTMTEEEARAAYDALSGEAHASSSTSQFMTAGEIRQQLLDRLAALFGSGGGIASLAGAPAAGDALLGDAPAIWGQLFGSWGTNDGDGNAAAIDRDVYGFIGGIDREVAPGVRAGLAAGYSRATYDVAARSSSGDSDNFHIAGYAGTALGAVDLKGVVSYAYGKTDARRTVIVGGLTNNLAADYATHTFQAGAEAGYDLDIGSAVLTPFAGLAGIHVETEGFTETGGPAALTFASTGNTTGVSTLGLRARRQTGQVALTGTLAWRHAFGDVNPASRAAFASAPAATFAVRGTPISENALALETGIDLKLDTSTTLTFAYAGEYASDATDHGLRAELRFEF